MLKCSIRDLLWLLLLTSVLSAWYGHYRATIERQQTLQQSIAREELEYDRMEDEWNQYARQLPPVLRQIGHESVMAFDMKGVALIEVMALHERLTALGVTLPKYTD